MEYNREYDISWFMNQDRRIDINNISFEYESNNHIDIESRNAGVCNNRIKNCIAVFCKKCYTNYRVDIDMESIVGIKNHSIIDIDLDIIPASSLTFSIKECYLCHTKFPDTFITDFNMSKAISEFNLKGFTTVASCESHYTEESSRIYVLFKNKEILEYMDYLPDSWTVDWLFYKKYNKVMISGPEYGGGNYEKYYTIRDLEYFAYSLPTLPCAKYNFKLISELASPRAFSLGTVVIH